MHYTISDYLLDITQNSLEVLSKEISVTIEESEKEFSFSVLDNGIGMDSETLKKAIDPFYTDVKKHTKRKAGFGLSFLKQATEYSEGSFSITSEKGVGTEVRASFSKESFDTPPIGNIASTMVTLLSHFGDFELIYNRKSQNGSYSIRRTELIDALGELETVASIKLAQEFICSQDEEL